MYQHNFQFPDGSFFQYGEKQGDVTCRLEFNPNKCDWSIINQIIPMLKYPKITRLDFAVDYYEHDLSTYRILKTREVKEKLILSRTGRLETHYLGLQTSDWFTRIYNKAVQMREERKRERLAGTSKAGDEIPELWWRCESVKKDMDEKGLMTDCPFDFYLENKTPNIPKGLKLRDKALIRHLLEFPEDFAEIKGHTTRQRLKEILSDCYTMATDIEQPYEMWEKEKDALKENVIDMLRPAIDNGMHTVGIGLLN